MIEDGDTDEFNEAIKGFDIKSYEDLQVINRQPFIHYYI